jgi:ElaB/YqjD/DUF883 family membrane-anchored ribosome-binding protein
MSTTSSRLGSQAKEVSKDLKEMGHIVTDAAQEKIGQVRENATEFYEQGRDKIRGAGSAFEQYVRERPVKSLVIAAGIGVLFGCFWMRR